LLSRRTAQLGPFEYLANWNCFHQQQILTESRANTLTTNKTSLVVVSSKALGNNPLCMNQTSNWLMKYTGATYNDLRFSGK